MIFEDLSFLDFVSLNNYKDYLGASCKNKSHNNRHNSNMMLNPLNLKHLNRIDENEADYITLNLEDGIAPSRKEEALVNISIFLSHLKKSKNFIIVRTNPLDKGGAEEIKFLNDFGFDAIRLSKVETPQEIEGALKILSGDKELHISIESRKAFANIKSLRIDERVTTVNLGILDLLSSLGLPQSILKIGNPTIDYILSKLLIDSKTVGLHPVSFMYQNYKDITGFLKWCEYERDMGYDSKACLGPAQVKIANEVFGEDVESYKRALHIKKIFEYNASLGIHGFMDDIYGFIDEPIYKDALITLNKSKYI